MAAIDAFVCHRKGINLVKHQIDSFDEFVTHRIRNVVNSCNNITVSHNYLQEAGCHQHSMTVTFCNPRLARPSTTEKDGSTTVLTPHLCRMRGINYSAGLFADLHITTRVVTDIGEPVTNNEKRINNVCLGKIPIMVKSKFCVTRSCPVMGSTDCRYDHGGYFVVNGTEKVIVSNDRMSENQVFVFINTKVNLTFSHCAEIRSVSHGNDGSGTVKSLVLRASVRPNQYGKYVRVALPHSKQDVPVMVLFRALGVETDSKVADMVTINTSADEKRMILEHLAGSFAEGVDVRSSGDAIDTLMKGMNFGAPSSSSSSASPSVKQDYVRSIIARDILPHVGRDFRDKALYLAFMLRRLVRCVCGIDEPDDRDSYVSKRVDTPGVMMASLFRVHYVRMVKEMRNSLAREVSGGAWKPSGGFMNILNKINVGKHIKQSIIESGMKYALATGNWNVKGLSSPMSSSSSLASSSAVSSSMNGAKSVVINSSRKEGVAQVLNRLTYVATISHLRRINTPMEKNGKMVQPRKLHNSQWGIICPSETPEGASVGLVKNMAITASITGFSDPKLVLSMLPDLGVSSDQADGCYPVFVNGRIVGSHMDAVRLVNDLRGLRRSCMINVYTSIVLDSKNKIVDIHTEAGRVVRPLWIVGEDGTVPDEQKDSNWIDLVWNGVVEYIDVAESMTCMIAMSRDDLEKGRRGVLHRFKYTHMELHPTAILGAPASCIPFSDHNQAPRNTYQCLHPDETVLMADGSRVPIKHVRPGDKVVTFHPSTMLPSVTTVVHQYVRRSLSPLYRVQTISGRSIIATGNHNFMTTEGWKRVDQFVPGRTCVGIYVGDNRDELDNLETLQRMAAYVSDDQVDTTVTACFDHIFDAETFERHVVERFGVEKSAPRLCGDGKTWSVTHDGALAIMLHAVRRTGVCGDPDGRYSHATLSRQGLDDELRRISVRDAHLEASVSSQGMAVFVPIKSVTLAMDAGDLISDITVDHDNHSFIAGADFLSSNSSMCKQAIGVNVSNFNARFDTVNHVLHYPQKALVQTKTARMLHADELPNGINAMVAVMTFSGYNQEDSVLINRAAIQRGLFVSTMYKTFREQNNKNHANGEEEFFCKPDPSVTRNMKPCNYSLLQDNGFVAENTVVRDGDIIIGKCMPQKVGAVLMYRDNSVPYKGTDTAVIDRNCFEDNYFTTTNGDGYTFAKTRVRCQMDPVVGDKFSSRHAQKGTCGLVVDEWDMPVTDDGLVPDIIMNAHAIPSRMTVAQLLEGVLSKAACIRGKCGDGSPFQGGDFSSCVGDILQRAGYDRHGNERMRDPLSGKRMDVDIFFTPTYYQRLKHLSGQKVHSRGANGPVVLLTRQPTEGRSRDGALRQGNMETHVLIAHGVAQFMKERMMDCSDNFKVFTCQQCGFISDSNPDRGIYSCRACGESSAQYSEVRIPYSAKLLVQEMMSLGVGSRIRSE